MNRTKTERVMTKMHFWLFVTLTFHPDRSQNLIDLPWMMTNHSWKFHAILSSSFWPFCNLGLDLWPDRSKNLINLSLDDDKSCLKISCNSVQYFFRKVGNIHTNLWPDRCMRVASTGSMTPCRLPLVARMTWPRLPLHLLRTRRPQKFVTSFQDACDLVGMGGSTQPHQPMKIQHPAWLTQRPRLGHQPMRGQRPIGIFPFQDLSLEPAGHPGVLSWSIPKASSPLICHSIPGQQPIRIEIASFAWTTLKSGVYINRPGLTPDRILQPTVREITSPDWASPHLLSSNPPPNPSLDCLLGN